MWPEPRSGPEASEALTTEAAPHRTPANSRLSILEIMTVQKNERKNTIRMKRLRRR